MSKIDEDDIARLRARVDEIADNLRRSGGPVDDDGKPYEIGIWSDRLYAILDERDLFLAERDRLRAERDRQVRVTEEWIAAFRALHRRRQ